MKKVLLISLSVILLLSLSITSKLFLIGQPVDGSTVNCLVREHDNQVDIYVTTPDSAIGFTDFRLHRQGTTLFIDFRRVLTSSLYDGQQSICIEKGGFDQIVLGGERIWTQTE